MLLGLQFAYDIGASFVLDIDGIASPGEHGGYPWFDQYTGLSYDELTLPYVLRRYNPTVVVTCPAYDALRHIAEFGDAACNTLYVMQGAGCCSYMHGTQDLTQNSTHQDCWYFDCTRGLLQHFQPIMIEKYNVAQSHDTVPLSTVYNPAEYSVAIHIRTGDVQLHIGDTQFFTNMIQSTVHAYLSHMPVHIYYIGQFGISNNTHTTHTAPTEDWSFLNTLHVNTSFYNPDEQTAIYHFIHADMTVITGSAFPYIAIAVSDKPVYVTAIPKTGVHDFLYDPGNSYSYDVDEHGRLEISQARAFERAIQHRVRL
jgi:hypothetical protein